MSGRMDQIFQHQPPTLAEGPVGQTLQPALGLARPADPFKIAEELLTATGGLSDTKIKKLLPSAIDFAEAERRTLGKSLISTKNDLNLILLVCCSWIAADSGHGGVKLVASAAMPDCSR